MGATIYAFPEPTSQAPRKLRFFTPSITDMNAYREATRASLTLSPELMPPAIAGAKVGTLAGALRIMWQKTNQETSCVSSQNGRHIWRRAVLRIMLRNGMFRYQHDS